MSILSVHDTDAQKKIDALEAQIKAEKKNVDAEIDERKRLLGSFFIELIENDLVDNLKEYTAENLHKFLKKKSDKKKMEGFIDKIGGSVFDNEKRVYEQPKQAVIEQDYSHYNGGTNE